MQEVQSARSPLDLICGATDGDGVFRRILPLLLLIGALSGLLGAEMAAASAPVMAGSAATATMMPGCTMARTKPDKAKHDGKCHGLTLQCIAAMGCTVPVADLHEAPDLARLPAIVLRPTAAPAPVLAGRLLSPEPEPPIA